jgi:hypothetical protein
VSRGVKLDRHCSIGCLSGFFILSFTFVTIMTRPCGLLRRGIILAVAVSSMGIPVVGACLVDCDDQCPNGACGAKGAAWASRLALRPLWSVSWKMINP